MDCPRCGYDLGDGMVPARCPGCGANLANPSDSLGAVGADHRRRDIEGLTGIGHGNRSARRRHGIQLAVALAVVAAFVAVVVAVVANAGILGDRVVPDVVGWRQERAVSELEGAGCVVEVAEEPSADVDAGLVTGQSLAAGTKVAQGTAVTLTVAQRRVMPDLLGKGREEAQGALDALAVPVDFTDELSAEPEGTVIASSVEAGHDLGRGVTVRLTLALSPRVPDVVGKDVQAAERAITDAGLKITRRTVAKEGATTGQVISQVPAAGAQVAPGSEVTIDVVGQEAQLLRSAAERVIQAVFGTDPASDGVGAALRPLLAESSPYRSSSDHEIWYGLVKGGGQVHTGVPEALQALPRSVVDQQLSVDAERHTVVARVAVRWLWDAMGAGYQGVVSQDVHEVTMVFDENQGLLGYQDAQTDVPAYDRY